MNKVSVLCQNMTNLIIGVGDLEAEDIELGGFQEEFEDQEVSNNDAEALDTESEEDTADNDLSNLPEDAFEGDLSFIYSFLLVPLWYSPII